MLVDPMYYAVFYDVALPKTDEHAMKKRITYFKYRNLTDGIFEEKQVVLDGVEYRITQQSTFSIVNSVDNHQILICDVEKI